MGDERVLRRTDALLVGLTPSQLRGQVAAGAIDRVRRGSYLQPISDPVGRHSAQVAAAVADQTATATVSHVSAAVLHGLPIWGIDLTTVHLTKPRANAGRRTPLLHVHAAPIDDVAWSGGVLVTTVARTVFDIACTHPFEQAVVVADAALHDGMVARDDLELELDRGRRRWGRRRAELALRFADGRSESVGESRSRVGMHRAGLPAPGLQFRVLRPDGSVAGRADFDWISTIGVPLLGEFDGLVKYEKLLAPGQSASEVVVREKRREDEFRDLGNGVVRWVWAELDRPPLWARINRALRRAGWLGT